MNDRKVKLGHRLQSCLKIGQQIRLTTPSLGKITPASQAQLPQVRIADSNSTNAVSFSSACTTKRFPSSRCPSRIHYRSPFEWRAEIQRKLHPALLSLSAIISQYFTESLPVSLPDEFPKPRNLSANVVGSNDLQAHGQYHRMLCP